MAKHEDIMANNCGNIWLNRITKEISNELNTTKQSCKQNQIKYLNCFVLFRI